MEAIFTGGKKPRRISVQAAPQLLPNGLPVEGQSRAWAYYYSFSLRIAAEDREGEAPARVTFILSDTVPGVYEHGGERPFAGSFHLDEPASNEIRSTPVRIKEGQLRLDVVSPDRVEGVFAGTGYNYYDHSDEMQIEVKFSVPRMDNVVK